MLFRPPAPALLTVAVTVRAAAHLLYDFKRVESDPKYKFNDSRGRDNCGPGVRYIIFVGGGIRG
jgi:hypothetical protein